MIPKRVAFVLSQATSDGQYEAVTESHGFDASDIKDNARSLSDCTTLDVRKAALEWASQQAASGSDSPRLTQLGLYVDSNVTEGKVVRLCTDVTWKQTLASFKGTLIVYLCAEQLVKAVKLQGARATPHTRSPLADLAVELSNVQTAQTKARGSGSAFVLSKPTTPNVQVDKKRGPGDDATTASNDTASSGASGAASDRGARPKAARVGSGSAHGDSALRRGALSNDGSSDDDDDDVAHDRRGSGQQSDDGVESEVDDSDDSDVASECLSDTDGPTTSAAGASAADGAAAAADEDAASDSDELSEDEFEDLASDQERDPITVLEQRYGIDLGVYLSTTSEARGRFCTSVENLMELEEEELRERYLAELSESARWGELFVQEGRGDASLTMNHAAFAQHGLVAKLRISREAVARFPLESGVNAFPNPRVAYCGLCEKLVAASRLGSLDSLKKHMVDRHHPHLGDVLAGTTALADMEDPPEGGLKPHHSSAAQCRDNYKVAPEPSVAIKNPKYKSSLSTEGAYVPELPALLAAAGGGSAGGR